MTIDVNTVQGQLRWATPHVGQESCVTVAPTITDGDTASPVISKILVPRVQASIFHARPNSIFAGAVVALAMIFADVTPAAFGIAGSQVGLLDQCQPPTVAEAPVLLSNRDADLVFTGTSSARFWGALSDDCKAREALTQDVSVLRHELVYGTQLGER